jgi:hypothetical protein
MRVLGRGRERYELSWSNQLRLSGAEDSLQQPEVQQAQPYCPGQCGQHPGFEAE